MNEYSQLIGSVEFRRIPIRWAYWSVIAIDFKLEGKLAPGWDWLDPKLSKLFERWTDRPKAQADLRIIGKHLYMRGLHQAGVWGWHIDRIDEEGMAELAREDIKLKRPERTPRRIEERDRYRKMAEASKRVGRPRDEDTSIALVLFDCLTESLEQLRVHDVSKTQRVAAACLTVLAGHVSGAGLVDFEDAVERLQRQVSRSLRKRKSQEPQFLEFGH